VLLQVQKTMTTFTHIDDQGRIRMVDISSKPNTMREAVAQCKVVMEPETYRLICDQKVKKGNVLETARLAGIMAAKKTSELIPLCHHLPITHVQIDFFSEEDGKTIRIEATVRVTGKTGVEMEALVAASLAALTIYDMCKSYDRAMNISDLSLIRKSGGKSGTFIKK